MARRMLLTAALALGVSTSGASAGLLEGLLDSAAQPGYVPECIDGAVLGEIQSKFDTADSHILHTGLAIGPIGKVRQTFLMTEPSPVVRRYCSAEATMSDGRRSQLFYLIEQRQGFVGISWNVEFCMPGYEPWRVHDGGCRTVRKWW